MFFRAYLFVAALVLVISCRLNGPVIGHAIHHPTLGGER